MKIDNSKKNTSSLLNYQYPNIHFSKHLLLIFIFLLKVINNIISQQISVSGYIHDYNTGENLIGAHVFTNNLKCLTFSNNYGHFNIKISKTDTINFSYVGYKNSVIYNLQKDTIIIIRLIPSIQIDKVDIVGNRNNLEYIGINKIDIKQIKTLPIIAGETDILKSLQLLPGIQGGIEGTSGFHVRGSSPDQNLFLVDGVPVYNVNHFFGVFSVFNTDAINNAELYKSIFPARYGGRIASVLDITMKEGNKEGFHGNTSIGLISSKILLEGPIKSSKTSYLLTARRTYFDLFMVPILWIINEKEYTGGYYFYDINAKINHTLNNKNRFFLSIYNGKDKYYIIGNDHYSDNSGYSYYNTTKNKLGWGNFTSLFRWNRIIGENSFMNVSLFYSQFNFGINNFWKSEKKADSIMYNSEFHENQSSVLNDAGISIDFDSYLINNYKLKYGVKFTHHLFNPGNDIYFITDIDQTLNVDTTFSPKKYLSNELNLYIENDIKFNILKANIGIRYSYYDVFKTSYNTIEPRILLNINLNKAICFQTSFSKNYQFIHLLTSSTIGFPTDQWVPVTEKVRPIEANQFSTGFQYLKNNFRFNIDAFYKNIYNLLEFKEGGSIASWEEKVTQGKGKAYGIEFYFGKEYGKTKGWIAYTLSYSKRFFNELNFGKEFPYKYDRRHDLKIVILYKINEKWEISANWILSSGYAYTLAIEKYRSGAEFDRYYMFGRYTFSDEIDYIENRNNMRMPLYHRLDIGASYNWFKKNTKRQLCFGLYNAYNKLNPIYLEFFDGEIYQTSVLPILPYINYNIDF
jgi:hypothetical protein